MSPASRLSIAILALGLMLPSLAMAAGTLTTLYRFTGGVDGQYPSSGVIAVDGLLYGTTFYGGVYGAGTVFSLDPATGAETVLHSFTGGADGNVPRGALVQEAGTLYGVTGAGGNAGCDCGTVYALDIATRSEAVLHAFTGTDGKYPAAGLLYHDGGLYGTASWGGKGCEGFGCGTVFKLVPKTAAFRVLHAFEGGADGEQPWAELTYASGLLFGTTFGGACAGGTGCGTVFRLDPDDGTETVLHRFAGGTDGSFPLGTLLYSAGLLYGTTSQGGTVGCKTSDTAGCGAVFAVDAESGAETVLSRFPGGTGGQAPKGGLVLLGGRLYGSTYGAAAATVGTLYKIDPVTGGRAQLYGFSSAAPKYGEHPQTGLIHQDGAFYGTTEGGGKGDNGTVFKIVP